MACWSYPGSRGAFFRKHWTKSQVTSCWVQGLRWNSWKYNFVVVEEQKWRTLWYNILALDSRFPTILIIEAWRALRAGFFNGLWEKNRFLELRKSIVGNVLINRGVLPPHTQHMTTTILKFSITIHGIRCLQGSIPWNRCRDLKN